MIPDETIERLRESADIVKIIGEFVDLKKQGTDYRGPCPFHQGTHRNFSVSQKRGSYKCFVCGEGGDVFTFVQKRLGLDWPSAVKLVGEKTGIEVVDVDTRRGQGPDPREPLWEVNAAAADYFQRMLWDDERGAAAREYLEQRRISRPTAERFGFGFAPREIGLLRAHLGALGFDDERLLAAGILVQPDEEGTEPRPRFRTRLVFPIRDLTGHVAGFGGRLLGAGEPKYLNSAESATFSKGRLLYNLHGAKQHIRRDERVLVVEGYFDVVRLVDAGIESVVAPLGTAMTDEQARLVARYTKNVYLLYDSDQAGLKATFRSGDELLRHGCTVQVVTLPEGEDPDTFVDARGAAALEQAIGNAIDIFERKVQLLERGGWFADLVRKRRAIDRLLPTIRATSDPLTRDLYLNRAAEASGVSRELLLRELASPASGDRGRPARSSTGAAPTPPPRPAGEPPPESGRTWITNRQMELRGGDRRGGWERRGGKRAPERGADVRPQAEPRGAPVERELLRVLLQSRDRVDSVLEKLGPRHFLDRCSRAIFRRFAELGADAEIGAIADGLEPQCVELLDRLLAEPDAVRDIERTITGAVNKLLARDLARQRADVLRLMELAEGAERDELWARAQRLKSDIQAIDGRYMLGGG